MADFVGLALLVVLETLEPAERLAFVLHDVFGAVREIAGGRRRRSPPASWRVEPTVVSASVPRTRRGPRCAGRIVDGFLAPRERGDFDALIDELDPDVVFRFDGGGAEPLARPPLVGAGPSLAEILSSGAPFAPRAERVTVNGAPGALVRVAGRPRYVIGFTVASGGSCAIDLDGDPARWDPVRDRRARVSAHPATSAPAGHAERAIRALPAPRPVALPIAGTR